MNKLHINQRIFTSCSERANEYADVHNTTYLTYTSAHAWCTQRLSKCMHTLCKKMHMHSCMRAYPTVQKLLCHGSYCEFILSLAWAWCRLSFGACPPAGSTKSVAPRVAHVAQALFEHPHWCRPHLVCLARGCGPHPAPRTMFTMVFAGFFMKYTPAMTVQVMVKFQQPKFIPIYFDSHQVLSFFVSCVAKTKLSNHWLDQVVDDSTGPGVWVHITV